MPSIKSKVLKPWASEKKTPVRAFKVADYNSRAWRDYSYNLRASKLMCEHSGRPYQVHHLVVDHKIPVNEGGSFWDERNHWVINKWYHSKKTAVEQRGQLMFEWELNIDGEKIPK